MNEEVPAFDMKNKWLRGSKFLISMLHNKKINSFLFFNCFVIL